MHSSGAPPGSAAGTAAPSSSIRVSGTTCAAGMRRNTSVLPSASPPSTHANPSGLWSSDHSAGLLR